MPGGKKAQPDVIDPMVKCEKLKKVRKSKLEILKREGQDLEIELDREDRDEEGLEAQFELFRDAAKSVTTVHQQVLEILEEVGDEDVYMTEEVWYAEIKRRVTKLEVRTKKALASFASTPQSSGNRSASADAGRCLPGLELPTFGGEVREWLPFWSQFEEIHKNKEIPDSRKIQYLKQSTIEGSEARDLVMSYPLTAKSYPLAVEQLRKRYGRESMLVKVYVRDLIRLVIDNATHTKMSLSTLFVKLSAQLRALGTLGVTTDKCAAVIYPLVESCLPEEILRAWQRDPSYKEAQDKDGEEELQLLIAFLEREVGAEDNIKLACGGLVEEVTNSKDKSKSKKSSVATASSLVSVSEPKKPNTCLFCGKGHPTAECGQADKLTLEEKKVKISEGKACYSCLKAGHSSKKCKQFVKCLICGRKHSTIMCPDLSHHRSSAPSDVNKKEDKPDAGGSTSSMTNQVMSPEVAMQTLVVEIVGLKKTVRARLLVDSGSQKSYVKRDIAEDVGLCRLGSEKVNHILFGGVHTKPITHNRYKVVLKRLNGDYRCDFDVSDIPMISGKIPLIPNGPWIDELRRNNVTLTDHSHGLTEIGILVGADVAAKLMTGEKLELGSGPVAVNTFLGWTLMGKLPNPRISSLVTTPEVTSMSNMHVETAKLWELDVIGITDSTQSKSRKELEDAALHHFNSTVTRTPDGRYEVHLPWIEGHRPLPSNRNVAEKRLKSATDKIKRENIFEAYDKELKKWEADSKIEEVPESEWNNFSHYLPHRAVIKVGSTTPVRPVFDASCKVKGEPSLNDCLEKGPNMLEKIPAILTKIRVHQIGAIADIEKAFQQIGIVKKDREFLRFLWWTDDTCTKFKIYRHCRVVFGVTCSPFLLAATLKHIADHAPEHLKIAANRFVECTYVDNLAVSVQNLEELDKLKSDCDQLLLPAKFNLRGWEHGPSEVNKTVPLLGLLWNLRDDNFHLDVAAVLRKMNGPLTKRCILSLVHMLYDPIGFSCPVSILPRKMLQESWSLKLGWDAELPAEMAKEFMKWRSSIERLTEVSIPRRLSSFGMNENELEIHMFADASQNAYAVVVYVKVNGDNGSSVQLVLAKSRIKPIAKVTIPRMELLACLIGARLVSTVKNMLGMPKARTYCWTDSSSAFYWIRTDANWGIFVQNRVEEIRELTSMDSWRHVPGDQNPADLPSRGCSVQQLSVSRWWEGPEWLYLKEKDWPKSDVHYEEDEINREKKRNVVSSLVSAADEHQSAITALGTYEEMVSYVYRTHLNGKQNDLSSSDFISAEKELLILVQKWSFSGAKDQKLKKLPVVHSEDGLLKLKTRLIWGDFSDEFKFPVILPDDCAVVKALIKFEHLRNSHAGVSTLLGIIREKFWILRGRRTIRASIRACKDCQRFCGKALNPATPPLPKERIQASSPYQISGVDFFGPLILRNGRKTWVALFTCAVYRAVHLELVPTLTTEDFISALRRFVSRRSRPEIMYSDNGTNFVGCNNAFKEINWKKVMKHGNFRRIEWRFNPPTASWYGGWFERLVGVVKQTLRKVLGNSSLNQDELATVLCEVEAVVNQRPLTYISEEGDQLSPLTPQLFLSGERSTQLPEVEEIDQNGLSKALKYRKEISVHLRSRFRKEYLGQLPNMRQKDEKRSVKIGDVVLIGHDNQKRMDWPMGKITEVIPGKDGKVRVVRVKTNAGELLRPVKRIYPFEVDCQGAEEVESSSQEIVEDSRVEGVTKSGRKIKIPERLTYFNLY